MYIDKLDDIVTECKNAYHRTVEMKAFDVKSSTYIDFNVVIKILNLKLVIM